MKKWIQLFAFSVVLLLVFSSFSIKTYASNQVDITGGVKNEYDYEEYVFITGEPVKFVGTGSDVKVTVSDSKGKRVIKYTYKLKNENGDTLNRTIQYEGVLTEYPSVMQTLLNGTITKATETIKINGVTYSLVDFQFSNGVTIDNPPASNYYAGNIIAKKIYEKSVGRSKERIVVNIESHSEGYDNYWGSTETQITTQQFLFADGSEGFVENRLTSSKMKSLTYQENSASLSSFIGGYILNTYADMYSQYKYDFGKGENIVYAQASYTPVIERLLIPKLRDLSGYSYAKSSIEQLQSLKIYDENTEYFQPKLPMQRYDFTIAVSKAINLRVMEEPLKKEYVTIFKDVSRTTKDYQYLVAAYNKGVIKGVSATNFSPNGNLTREDAVTILIRALGLEGRLQDAQLISKYKDQKDISAYARAAVIEATRIGLVQGDDKGFFNPKKPLNRADASILISRFLNYLNDDLNRNYQEDILFF